MKVLTFLRKIYIGPCVNPQKQYRAALSDLLFQLKELWKHGTHFGFSRLLRFAFVIVQFFSLYSYIAHFFDKMGYLGGKIFAEFYVLAKCILTFVILFYIKDSTFFCVLAIYFLVDTVLFNAGIIMLSDVILKPALDRRSMVLLGLNYLQLCAAFALLYLHTDSIIKLETSLQALYFSFVTSTTLGFGEFHPTGRTGYLITIFQLIISVIFIALFVSYFMTRLTGKKNFMDEKNNT